MGMISPIFGIFSTFFGLSSEKKFHSELTTFLYLHMPKSGKIPKIKAKTLWPCDRHCPFSMAASVVADFPQKMSPELHWTFSAKDMVSAARRIPKFRVELRSTKIWRFFAEDDSQRWDNHSKVIFRPNKYFGQFSTHFVYENPGKNDEIPDI